MGSSVTIRRKSWGKNPNFGAYLKVRGQNLGYLSPIFLEEKVGTPARISEANFVAKPPRPPNMEVPPGDQRLLMDDIVKMRRNSCGKFYMQQNQNCHRDKYFRKNKEIILAKEMGTESVFLGNEKDSFLN